MRSSLWVSPLLLCFATAVACGSDDGPRAEPGASGSAGVSGNGGGPGGSTSSGGSSGAGGSTSSSGTGGGGNGGTGADDGGLDASDGAPVDPPVIGNPELFTQSVLDLDFDQGENGRFRANGGTWQDFNAWNKAGSNGNWSNVGVNVQTTNAVRTELVPNTLGAGRVLRTWIEAGDHWKTTATYPRTELTSSHTAGVPFKSEWRLELPFYVSGDVESTGASIIGFQFHHNGSTGSPPFALGLNDGNLRFSIKNALNDPNTHFPIFPLKPNTLVEIVVELKFGYVSDGAYVRLWANGQKYVDITDRNVGYPDIETTAGYWKFCSLYDWANLVKGSRNVHSGPVIKFSKRP
jgi:hypothetical protein